MKVASLRQRFNQSIAPGGLAGDRSGVVPASGFSFSSQEIWRVIKENKDLDLPAHKVRCQDIRGRIYQPRNITMACTYIVSSIYE